MQTIKADYANFAVAVKVDFAAPERDLKTILVVLHKDAPQRLYTEFGIFYSKNFKNHVVCDNIFV
ncbi:hypothetical protein Ruko_30440 [Ruthenibacterium sp. TH_2024_36131]